MVPPEEYVLVAQGAQQHRAHRGQAEHHRRDRPARDGGRQHPADRADDRVDRHPHRVLEQQGAFGGALGTGGHHVLLLQLVEHPAAHHPDQGRGSGQADDDHRHRQVRQQVDHPAHTPGGVDVLGREQAAHAGAEVAHHEHHQHQRQQELRRRQPGQADHRQRMVADRVLVGGG